MRDGRDPRYDHYPDSMPEPMGTLDGMVALVTGAASRRGIGRGIALAMAAAGAHIVVTDIGRRSLVSRAEPDGWRGLDSVVDEAQALGRRALGLELDVRRETDVRSAVARVLDALGRIDIVVNNAAAPQEPTVGAGWEITEEDWNAQFAVNLTGPFLVCRNVIPHMVARGSGAIINMSSVAGKRPLPRRPAYCATKHGIIGLTRSLASDLAAHGVTANAICPGIIDTDRGHARETPMQRVDAMGRPVSAGEWARKEVPAGHRGTPDDIANLAVFLASPASRYITGQAINVDGGWYMA
ncbi:MAG: SDR family oxidoreductase [Burkholderiales bacterium]|nr:SDR family oxidoreductase [Burkholderiales bacterium]